MVLDKLLDKLLPPLTHEFPPYDRLKPWQIRVLSLHKNIYRPRISGNLKTIDLIDHAEVSGYGKAREAPLYHALSYAAGDVKNKTAFKCDGRTFFIGFSLWQALVRLTDLDIPCPIWVDAICINQRDSKEKTRQIQQMAEVYKQAQRVWIWLGEARKYTLPAIKEIPRLVRALSGDHRSSTFQRDYDRYFDDSNMPIAKLAVWDGISDLVNRPYFGRLWVRQEAILAKRKLFLCGPHAFRWNDFQQLVHQLQRQNLWSFISSITPGLHTDASDFFDDINVYNISYGNVIKLRDILMARTCSGSRDRVMAVLGLLSADQQKKIKAHARLPKLYANFTSLVLVHDITLTTFILAGSHRGYDALPSWCPDYHAAQKVAPLSSISCRPQRNMPQSTEISLIVNASRKMWFQTEVIGYDVDVIDSVAPGAWPKRVRTNKALNFIDAGRALAWEAECSKLVNKGSSWWNLEHRRVYARTLIGGARVFEEPRKDKLLEFLKEPRNDKMLELLGIGVEPRADESSTDPAVHYEYLRPTLKKMRFPGMDFESSKMKKPPGATRYMVDVSHMCTDRAFFHTRGGRIGLGPSGLWRHDIVCFLGQATVPFILRPNQTSKQPGHPPVYRLLGEAYIDEFMEDCALGVIPPEARRRSFIIE
jgi:hypothetical protein